MGSIQGIHHLLCHWWGNNLQHWILFFPFQPLVSPKFLPSYVLHFFLFMVFLLVVAHWSPQSLWVCVMIIFESLMQFLLCNLHELVKLVRMFDNILGGFVFEIHSKSFFNVCWAKLIFILFIRQTRPTSYFFCGSSNLKYHIPQVMCPNLH